MHSGNIHKSVISFSYYNINLITLICIFNFIFITFRLDTISSPLSGTISSVGTPESLSSADSPSFSFQPVDSPSPVCIGPNSDDILNETSMQAETIDQIQTDKISQGNDR